MYSVFLSCRKIATTGEGGIVTTNDEQIYRNLLRLRSHGINKLDDHFENTAMAYDRESLNPWYYEMQQLGYNYRLTDIQAFGLVSAEPFELELREASRDSF